LGQITIYKSGNSYRNRREVLNLNLFMLVSHTNFARQDILIEHIFVPNRDLMSFFPCSWGFPLSFKKVNIVD
jgi:hypothetical protein